jgi:hypothetical protein
MAKSVRDLLRGKIDALANSTAPTAKSAQHAVKRIAAIYDSLANVREPILKQAADEQRTSEWSRSEMNKAFGSKVADLARIKHEIDQIRGAHRASRPALPAVDKTDVFAALESLELAKRVAATPADQRHKLSPAEKMAALRSPALSGITPSVAEAWTADILKATAPERLAAHDDGDSALEEVAEALTMARQSLQAATGFIDAETGLPSQAWSSFEREHMAPVKAELDKADAAAEQKRQAEALAQNVDAMAEAVKAMPFDTRRVFIDKALDMQIVDLKAS